MKFDTYRDGNGLHGPTLIKTCNTCGDDKPLHAFSRKHNSKDGLRNICKGCDNINRKDRGYAKYQD